MPQVDVPVSQKLRVTLLQREWDSCVIQSGIAKQFETSDTDDILQWLTLKAVGRLLLSPERN